MKLLSEEHKKKISEAIKLRHRQGLQPKIKRCQKCKCWLGQNHNCKKTLEKKRLAKLKNPIKYWLGKHRSEETKKKLSKAHTGKIRFRGKENPNWLGSWDWYHKEARKIMEKQLGRKLNRNEIIHHIDENYKNNNLINLKLVSRTEHILIHKPNLNNIKLMGG